MGKKPADQINQKLVKRLFSARDDVVLSAIHEIRNTGNPDMIPALMELYARTDSPEIIRAIAGLIGDLKSQPAVSKLFPAIRELSDAGKKQSLVAACWQSGLDFSAYIDIFLDIFLEEDYMTALEAFSVIENSLPFLQEKTTLEKYISYLKEKQAHKSISAEILPLFHELIKILEENLMFPEDQ